MMTSTEIIGKNEAACRAFGVDLRRNSAHARRQDRRHEALAGADEFGLADRFAREELEPDRSAAQLIDGIGFARAGDIAFADCLRGPGLPAHLRRQFCADTQIFGGDEHVLQFDLRCFRRGDDGCRRRRGEVHGNIASATSRKNGYS
jgi:hypothetical protein